MISFRTKANLHPLTSAVMSAGIVLIGSFFSCAHAGYWSGPVYDVSGRVPTNTATDNTIAPPGSEHAPCGGGYKIADAGNGNWAIADGGPIASGTVTATFTYHPDFSGDVPHEYVWIKETASASWGVPGSATIHPGHPRGSNYSSDSVHNAVFRLGKQPYFSLVQAQTTPGPSGANDGMGDPEVPYSIPDSTGHGGTSQGTHYDRYKVSNNQVVTDAVALSATCGETAPETIWSYNAEMTDYNVYISSNIETSYKKWVGAVSDLPNAYKQLDPTTHNPINSPNDKAIQLEGQNTSDPSDDIWKLQCLRNRDGSMTVESIGIERDLNGGTLYGGGVFTANSDNDSIGYPSYSWDVTGGSPSPNAQDEIEKDQATIDISPTAQLGGAGTTAVTYGGIDLGRQSDGTFLFHSSTVTVAVSDAAHSIQVKNNYTVNWHLERENWHTYGAVTSIYDYPTVDLASPGYAISGGSIVGSFVENGDFWGAATDTAIKDLTSVGSGLLPFPYNGLSAAANLLPGNTQTISTSVSFEDHWGAATSTYEPYRDDSLKSRYHMVPELRVGYDIKHWDGDSYDVHGYTGQDRRATATRNGAEEWIAKFELQNGESSTPGANG